MARSSVTSKMKVEPPSKNKAQRDQKKGAQKKALLGKVQKRQKELDSPIKSSPSLNSKQKVRQRKEKLKFSEVRSAFATYAKDASASPSTDTMRHLTKIRSSERGRTSRGSLSTYDNNISKDNCTDVLSSKRKFDERSSLSEEDSHGAQSSMTCSALTGHSDDNEKNSDASFRSPENLIFLTSHTISQLESLENNSEHGLHPNDDKSDNTSFTSPENHANSLSVAPSQLETLDSLSEYEANEEILHPNFQEECDKYAETFLNFKNVVKPQRLSNLPEVVVVPIEENDDQALVGFNENINLYGCATIKVMKGIVSVLGSLLSSEASEVTFYSPLCDPALVIKTQSSKESESDIEQNMIQKLLKDALSEHAAEIENLLACSTVIHLSGLKESHIYPKYKHFFEVPPKNVMWNELCKGCFLVGPNCVFIDFPGYHLACEEILPPAEMINDQSLSNSTAVVTVGSKGAGKSTFNRYLINCMLNHYELVNYIDCDIGQPEFTISGCISVNHVTSPILGPPFTHLRNPHFSTFYGAVTASNDVDRYIESVKNVLLHVKPGYPIVVNTMGWIKDVGMNLLADVIRMIQPSYVVQLSSRKEVRAAPLITRDYVDQFDSLKFITIPQAQDYKHFWIKTDLPTSNLASANPADRRLLRIFSYFTRVQNDCALRDLDRSNEVLSLRTLCSLKPYIVFVKDVLLCVCHETGVLREHALSVFNCSIVSLSVVSKEHFKDHSMKKYLEPPPTSKCYGFGIVRGVDPHKQALYIISNLPQETLPKVNCLSIGSLNIPDALYNTDEARSTDTSTVPYAVDKFPFHITGSNRFRSYKIFK